MLPGTFSGGPRSLMIANAARLKQTGPAGGLYDDELLTQDAGHARVYLPVDGTGARWELLAGRFAIPALAV